MSEVQTRNINDAVRCTSCNKYIFDNCDCRNELDYCELCMKNTDHFYAVGIGYTCVECEHTKYESFNGD